MSKYNCPTSPRLKGNVDGETDLTAVCAFGVPLLTPAIEAEIDRRLGVDEKDVQTFLDSVKTSCSKVFNELMGMDEPTDEELRDIELNGI